MVSWNLHETTFDIDSDPIYAFTSIEGKMYYSDGEELVLVQGNNEQWRIIVGAIRNLHLWNNTVIIIG